MKAGAINKYPQTGANQACPLGKQGHMVILRY